MTDLFRSIQTGFDINRLQSELNDILAMTTWDQKENQISLQYRAIDSDDPWHSGVGSTVEIKDGKRIQRFTEQEFDLINPALAGTYTEHVLKSLPFQPVRTRIMRMLPKRCYSVHVDGTARYHLALVTSYHARFIFTEAEKIYHIPADGNLYFVDTTQEHTAINGNTEDRVHMVMLPR